MIGPMGDDGETGSGGDIGLVVILHIMKSAHMGLIIFCVYNREIEVIEVKRDTLVEMVIKESLVTWDQLCVAFSFSSISLFLSSLCPSVPLPSVYPSFSLRLFHHSYFLLSNLAIAISISISLYSYFLSDYSPPSIPHLFAFFPFFPFYSISIASSFHYQISSSLFVIHRALKVLLDLQVLLALLEKKENW